MGRFDWLNAWQSKGWFRRILPNAVRPGEGRLAEPTLDRSAGGARAPVHAVVCGPSRPAREAHILIRSSLSEPATPHCAHFSAVADRLMGQSLSMPQEIGSPSIALDIDATLAGGAARTFPSLAQRSDITHLTRKYPAARKA